MPSEIDYSRTHRRTRSTAGSKRSNRMSTIEPTEAQKQAARDFCRKHDVKCNIVLARLLAEREAKLRETGVRIGVSTGQAERDALREDLARANDERVRANGYLLAAQKSEMAMKGKLADARARVAELESSERREAQHLANVKAWMDALFAPNGSGIVHTEGGEG